MNLGLWGALLASAAQNAFPGPRAVSGTRTSGRVHMPTSVYYATHAGKAGRVAQARRAAKKKRNQARK